MFECKNTAQAIEYDSQKVSFVCRRLTFFVAKFGIAVVSLT